VSQQSSPQSAGKLRKLRKSFELTTCSIQSIQNTDLNERKLFNLNSNYWNSPIIGGIEAN
jgi:hypothetical protein